MRLPIIPHSRTNKILCLVLLGMVLCFLMIGGIFALLGDADIGLLLCIPAGITSCFSLLYGIIWAVYAKKEKTRQKKLERAAELLKEPSDNVVTYHEFIVPRKDLINASKNRFQKVVIGLAVSAIAIFVILYGILLIENGFNGIIHLLSVMGFCIVIVIPGIVIQFIIFFKYAGKVPGRIMLFPNKIIIDRQQYCTYEIKKINVSSYSSAGKDTSMLYRKLVITTEDRSKEYTIDYCFAGDDAPRWSRYGEFLMELCTWADQNKVQLTVNFVD